MQKNRHCLCLPDCLDETGGEVEFVENAGMLGGIRHHYPAMMWRYVQRCYGSRPASIRKSTRSIADILRASAAPAVIDYWSLDTEGSELAILRGFPFEAYRIRVLTVEHNRQPVRYDIERLLNRHGYRRVHDFGIDDAYLDADLALPSSHSATWRSAALRRR